MQFEHVGLAFSLTIQAGLATGLGSAIHNMPGRVAVTVPIYYATGSRKEAFTYSFLSGLAEPAEAYGHHHLCIYGLIAGMGVMALNLLLLL